MREKFCFGEEKAAIVSLRECQISLERTGGGDCRERHWGLRHGCHTTVGG